MAALSSLGSRRTRIIAGEQIGSFARWQFASMAPDGGAVEGGIIDPQALREAHDQGYAQGLEAGRTQAWAEARAQMAADEAQRLQQIAHQLACVLEAAQKQLDDAHRDIARGTLEIACTLARQVLRHETVTRPEALEPVVREALGQLLGDSKPARVRLAPADFDRLDAPLRAEFAGQAVSVVADANVAPGDCLVESAGAVIDGGLQTRWNRAVARLGLHLPWREDGDDA